MAHVAYIPRLKLVGFTLTPVTGFDPQFQHAQEKWQQFSTCIQAMGQLDDRTWETLLEASLAAQQTEPLLPR